MAGKNGRLPPAAPGIRKFRRLLAQESRGIIPLGKARFPPGIFPAFPGCKASGLTAFSGRARSKTATSLAFFFQINSGKLPARYVKLFPQVWVQGGHLPGGVRGKAPPFSSTSSPNFHFMRNPCLTKYLRLNKPARSCIMAVARNRADREEAYVRKNRRAARRGPTGSRD